MLIPALLLLQATALPPQPAQRTVAGPVVIATDQRITPAGVQSAFEERAERAKPRAKQR